MKYFSKVFCLSFCFLFMLLANEVEQSSINIEYGSHDPLKLESASSNYEYVTPEYYENVIENAKEGNRLSELGQLQPAIGYFELAINYDSTYVFAYNGLANTYIKLKNYSKAETLLTSAIVYGKKEAFLYNNLANLYLMEGKVDLALENLRAAVEYNPNSSLINYNLANVYYKTKRFSTAIMYYKKALQLDANLCDARYNLALSYQKKGLRSLMIKEYEELVKRCPAHTKGVLNLAAYYISIQQVDKAILLYKQALVLNQDTQVYLALGHLYHNKAYYEQEVSAYTSAVKADSTNMDAWKYLAMAYMEQGMIVSARTTCENALKIQADDESILHILKNLAGN